MQNVTIVKAMIRSPAAAWTPAHLKAFSVVFWRSQSQISKVFVFGNLCRLHFGDMQGTEFKALVAGPTCAQHFHLLGRS